MQIRFGAVLKSTGVIGALFCAPLLLSTSHADAQSVYRCFSASPRVGTGSCTAPPITFNQDGTYRESSASGRYGISGDEVTLAGSIRGPGRISADGRFITFQFPYAGRQQTWTYNLMRGQPLGAGTSSAGARTEMEHGNRGVVGRRVSVNLTIRFRTTDGSARWMSLVILTPEGQPPARPAKIITTEALFQKPTWSVRAQFDPPNTAVPTGVIYDVWVDTGMEKRRIGKLDLRNVTGDTDVTIDAKTVERR